MTVVLGISHTGHVLKKALRWLACLAALLWECSCQAIFELLKCALHGSNMVSNTEDFSVWHMIALRCMLLSGCRFWYSKPKLTLVFCVLVPAPPITKFQPFLCDSLIFSVVTYIFFFVQVCIWGAWDYQPYHQLDFRIELQSTAQCSAESWTHSYLLQCSYEESLKIRISVGGHYLHFSFGLAEEPGT